MKFFAYLIVGLLAILVDSIVLPALFQISAFSCTMVYLVALILAEGIDTSAIAAGLLVAGAGELWHGLFFGTLILSWLLLIVLWMSVIRIVDIKPFIHFRSLWNSLLLGMFGLLGVIGMSILFLLIIRILYNHIQSFTPFLILLHAPSFYISSIFELFGIMILFRLITPLYNRHG